MGAEMIEGTTVRRQPAWDAGSRLPPSLSETRRLRTPVMAALFAAGAVVVGVGASQGALAGAVALLAVAVGIVLLQQPAIAGLLLMAAVPVTSGLRRGLPIPGLRLSELLIGTAAVALLLFPPRGVRVRWRAFDWVALAYVAGTAGLGVLDVVLLGESPTTDEAMNLVAPLQFFLLYRAVLLVVVAYPDLRRWAPAVLLTAGACVAALALMQVANVPGVRALLQSVAPGEFDFAYSVEGGLPRATGPFPGWHALGGYTMLLILLGVALLLEGSGRVMRRRRLVGVLVLSACGLAATISFAPIAGAIGGAVVLALWTGRAGQLLAGLAIACILGAVLFGSELERRSESQFAAIPASQRSTLLPPTLQGRVLIWKEQYLPPIKGRWATGWGPTDPPTVTWLSPESIYIYMLLRGGLALLAIYLALMWVLAETALRGTRSADPDRRATARALFVGVLALTVIQAIVPLLVGAGTPQLLWLLAALVMADRAREREAS